MDQIRINISSLLSLTDDTMNKMLDRLQQLGVTCVGDLVDVQLEDIILDAEHPHGVLLPIPARRLIRLWSTRPESSAALATGNSASVSSSPPSVPLSNVDIACSWEQNFDVEACVTGMLCGQALARQSAKKLKDGKKMTSTERNEVVRHIAENIVKQCRKPHRNSLNVVADGIVKRYSQLKDDIDGFQLGDGYISLRNQLENRIAYIHRPVTAKRKSVLSKRDDDQENRPQKKVRDGYGCLDFLPVELPDGESSDSLAEKKRLLKLMFTESTWNTSAVTDLMATTYVAQRHDLVGVRPLSVIEIKAEWPFLMECQWFIAHLTRLLGFNIVQKLEASLSAKKESLMSFFATKCASMKALKKRMAEVNNEPDVSLILLIMSYFKEEEKALFHGYEVS